MNPSRIKSTKSQEPTLSELKKELSKMTQKQLVNQIASLYQRFDSVKEFYSISVFSDELAVLEKYKDIIKDEFISARTGFPKMRLSVARKAISDYIKLSSSTLHIADLMVLYVESGVECTQDYGDIDEKFYTSMEAMYERATKYIHKENLGSTFESRLEDIVNETAGMGWGFHDQLADTYYSYRDSR